MRQRLLIIISCCLLLSISACKSKTKSQARVGGNITLRKGVVQVQAKSITEKYWKLVEINGKAFVMKSSFRREPFLILKIEGNRINGFSGSNLFNGRYVMNGSNIKFLDIVTAEQSCHNVETENALIKALNKCESYTLSSDGKYLSLNNSRTTRLARFEVVYLR